MLNILNILRKFYNFQFKQTVDYTPHTQINFEALHIFIWTKNHFNLLLHPVA